MGGSEHIWHLSGKIARISSRAGNLSPDLCSGWQATATGELCPCSAPAHTPLLAPFAFVYRERSTPPAYRRERPSPGLAAKSPPRALHYPAGHYRVGRFRLPGSRAPERSWRDGLRTRSIRPSEMRICCKQLIHPSND